MAQKGKLWQAPTVNKRTHSRRGGVRAGAADRAPVPPDALLKKDRPAARPSRGYKRVEEESQRDVEDVAAVSVAPLVHHRRRGSPRSSPSAQLGP